MGLFSSKSSSSSTTNLTERNVGADNGSIAVAEGSSVTINTLDANAVERSLEFASESAERAFSATQAAQQHAYDFSSAGEQLFYNAVEGLAGRFAQQSQGIVNSATDAIERTTISQTTSADDRLTKVIAFFVVAGVVVAVAALTRGKKNGS